jgi:tyrosine-protein kinase Etk/Wzc
MKSGELGLWDYFAILVKWRKLIVINFVTVCLIAIGVSFVLPKWYEAKATLLPPIEQPSGALGLASVLSELPFGEFGLPEMGSPSEVFKAILESQTVAEAIVQRWNLMDVYKKEKMEHAVQALWDRSQIEITEEGLISITVEERSPELAAGIANSFVEELDRVNQLSSVSQAKNTRIFIEGRLEETQVNLKKAEERLRLFQEENKTISLPDQTAAAIQSAAELKARQVAIEIERGVLLKTLSSSHPQVVRLQSEIAELQKQLDQIALGTPKESRGTATDQSNAEGNFNVPLLEVPTVGLQLARLTREVKIQEAIFELLTTQYEQAKIQEAKDTPTVQVLDRAKPPEIKSRPVRRRIALLGGVLSIFLSFIFIGGIEYLHRLREWRREEYNRLQDTLGELKADLDFCLRKIGLRRKKRVGFYEQRNENRES